MAAWTEPSAVGKALQRRWKRGELLRDLAEGREWAPFSVPVIGPRPGEIAGDLESVRTWVARWDKASASGKPIRLERRTIGGRRVGRNELPGRAWVDSYTDAWSILGVRSDVEDFSRLLRQASDERIVDWVTAHPFKALAVRDAWQRIQSTIAWIEAHRGEGVYLRQIDAPGIDTKFIEAHGAVLASLLDDILPSERINTSAPASAFARRYGFTEKPEYVRFRFLDPSFDGLYSELSVRASELAAEPPKARRIYIVENEITYLAFPPREDAIVIFGAGFGLGRLRQLDWLTTRRVFYWGDLDTYGFAILHQLRSAFGGVQSILMDRGTLLSNQAHWSREPKQHTGMLSLLTDAESDVYAELLAHVHAPSLRLEQERIPMTALSQ